MLNKKVAADRRMKLLNIITYVYLSWMLLVVPSFLVIINVIFISFRIVSTTAKTIQYYYGNSPSLST